MANWHDALLCSLSEAGMYCVTGATLYKRLIFHTRRRLDLLEGVFFELAQQFRWRPQAWSFFPNHYHFVAASPEDAASLAPFVQAFHSIAARGVNAMDGTEGRQVWYKFWDNRIATQGSFLARLQYVHQNAVHHGVVPEAEQYRWSSAAWFARNAGGDFFKAVSGMKIDRVKIFDDFQPSGITPPAPPDVGRASARF